jgi:hypothetical protein
LYVSSSAIRSDYNSCLLRYVLQDTSTCLQENTHRMIPMHSVSFNITYIHPENQENSCLKIHHFFTLKFTLYIHQPLTTSFSCYPISLKDPRNLCRNAISKSYHYAQKTICRTHKYITCILLVYYNYALCTLYICICCYCLVRRVSAPLQGIACIHVCQSQSFEASLPWPSFSLVPSTSLRSTLPPRLVLVSVWHQSAESAQLPCKVLLANPSRLTPPSLFPGYPFHRSPSPLCSPPSLYQSIISHFSGLTYRRSVTTSQPNPPLPVRYPLRGLDLPSSSLSQSFSISAVLC